MKSATVTIEAARTRPAQDPPADPLPEEADGRSPADPERPHPMAYRIRVQLPSVRLASHLNALNHARLSAEVAARAITEPDVAHHVVDRDQRLGLDPFAAHPLETVLAELRLAERDSWVLALPVPGSLGALRGPRDFNEAALAVGEAVIGVTAGIGLVPTRVGPAVQWEVFAAERPFTTLTPYDAERALSEVVIEAAAALTDLQIAGGTRPRNDSGLRLAPGYPSRQLATADRAARLLQAAEVALADDGGSISVYEADRRALILRKLRAAASDALCAAVSFPPRPESSVG